MKKDIEHIEDIQLMVDAFYGKVRIDALLGGIFNGVIQDRWPEHLSKMYRFWQTVLLDEHTYRGRPFAPHALLPIQQKHFDRWLELFTETVDELFDGERASFAKSQAGRMATMFISKINYFRNNQVKPIL